MSFKCVQAYHKRLILAQLVLSQFFCLGGIVRLTGIKEQKSVDHKERNRQNYVSSVTFCSILSPPLILNLLM